MVADDFHALVDSLHKSLPDCILRSVVLNSVKNLLKKNLTKELLRDTCWRLAGNLEVLLDGEPVPVWTRQKKFEWVPVEICEVQTVKQFNRLGNRVTFSSLSGSIVPRRLVQFWSFRKTHYLATYRDEKNLGFGFGRHKLNKRGEQLGNLLFYDIRQFYGLQCLLLLDPTLSKVDPQAVEIGHSGALMKHNRELLTRRDRLVTPCVRGKPDNWECFSCPYGTDKCSLATHAKTYTIGECSRCGSKNFFDPIEIEHPNICVNCVFEERRT